MYLLNQYSHPKETRFHVRMPTITDECLSLYLLPGAKVGEWGNEFAVTRHVFPVRRGSWVSLGVGFLVQIVLCMEQRYAKW